jgi:hypothetical protein
MSDLEPQMSRLALQRERFLLAASDMEQCAAAAVALEQLYETDGENTPLIRALETGMVTCYARPFTRTRGGARWLDETKWAPTVPRDSVHHGLIDLRNKVYAHTDAESGRTPGPPILVELTPGASEVTHSEGWWPFPRSWLPHVVGLCDEQTERFYREAQTLLDKARDLAERNSAVDTDGPSGGRSRQS